MESSIFFIYLSIVIAVSSVMSIMIRRILAIRARKERSKKGLESFLTLLSESYYKAFYKENSTISFGKRAKNMRQSIEEDLALEFNYLFCSFSYFPKSFQKNYIDEVAGLFVDKMIPVLESLQQNMLLDKQSRPKISTLQKIFFDRLEIEMIHHLSNQDDD
jgi:hypothetical protein